MRVCRVVLTTVMALIAHFPSRAVAQQEFFDDFRYSSASDPALKQFGWHVRNEVGGPGCEGAAWESSLIEFWGNPDFPGDKVLGLIAYTDGFASGTGQSEIRTANSRFKNGTYAARIQFSRAPGVFVPKEPSVQAFFTYSGQTAQCAESFCECDFEFLPTPGTFGLSQSGIWATTHETGGDTCPDGISARWGDTTEVWRICMIRVHDSSVEYFVDGARFALHADRFPPESVMQIMFNHWFDCDHVLPRTPLGYSFAVDWLYYSDSETLGQADIVSRVGALRGGGTSRLDTVALRAKLTANDDATMDQLGYTVSVSNNTAVVGAYFDDERGPDSGSAYVFERTDGVWTQIQKLTASDGVAGDNFGASVSVSGNAVVVGALKDDDRGTDAGSAYVFEKIGGVWTEVSPKLIASDGAAGDFFGVYVSLSGDTAIVGALYDDSRRGSAYVFEKVGGVWTQVKKLTAFDGVAGDHFGHVVCVDGDTAIVGAHADDGYTGSAYLFERVGGLWTEVHPKLKASDSAQGKYFGVAVSVAGQIAVVGSHLDSGRGAAYVFENRGGLWTQVKKLTALDGASGDQFGFAVSVKGNSAIVGAYADDDRGTDSGAVYVFDKVDGVWVQEKKLTASDGATGDNFGLGIALASGTAIIGAQYDDDRGMNSGAAYLYDLEQDASRPSHPCWWTRQGATGPSPRHFHAMTYDAARREIVLFGGEAGGAGTWLWDGVSWTQRGDPGPARLRHAMAYDDARAQVVLFGGTEGANETWVWGGTSWTKRTVAGPSGRNWHAMVYDSARDEIILFGGRSGSYNGDTWSWNGSSWTLRSTSGPSPREGHAMAYDPVRQEVVLFGGSNGAGPNGETWAWNGASWAMRSDTGPSPRYGHSMAFDVGRGAVILFGGNGPGGVNGETWSWDGSMWTQRQVVGPSARYIHAMAYHAASGKVVLFGGFDTAMNGETWTYAPPCAAEFTCDSTVDFADYLIFLNLYEAADPMADLNDDSFVDFADYLEFLNHYEAGC